MKFEVGQKVVRGYSNIKDSGGVDVVQGGTYTVTHVNMTGSLIRLRGCSDWFESWKFARMRSYDS